MLKHIADLSDDNEYFIGWSGQSTSRPWGSKAETFQLFSEYEANPTGLDLTNVVVVTGTGTETLAVGTTLTADQWVGAYLRLGTTTTPLVGYARVVSNLGGVGTSSITVVWEKAGAAGTVSGILTYEDYRWASRPQVRVLTPYQPTVDDTTLKLVPYPDTTATVALGGRSVTMGPGFTTPAAATFERSAALLEWTFNEGIDSFGISEVHLGGACTGAAATTFDFTTGTTVGVFYNGYLRVDWTDSGSVPRVSYSRIVDNTANQFTGLSWQGDGTPDFAGGTISRWTAWLPHYNNNPYCYAPGEGYSYPNNDPQPCAFSTQGAAIRNRARNITGVAYPDQFGDMLIVATRMSMATGKRINVVHLGINAAGLTPINVLNPQGFDGILGWYDHRDAGTWAPSVAGSMWSRMDTMLRYCVANAMEADGNTKPVKFLAWFYSQGETDALNRGSRLHYGRALNGLKTATRNLIDELGYSPYTNGAQVPWIQPRIMHVAYELEGTYIYYSTAFTFTGDAQGLVNNAIVELAASDEFSDWIYTEDLPRKSFEPSHLHGVGECARGARTAKRMAELVDHALGFGSSALTNADSDIVNLYNRALAAIGEAPDIQSLSDGSEQVRLCQLFGPECRDTLLQIRQWSFAMRRVALTEVKMPQQTLYTQYGHCYVVPPEALNAIHVLPPDAIEEPPTEAELISWATDAGYPAEFVAAWNTGLARNSSLEPGTVDASTLPLVDVSSIEPQKSQIERSPFGGRYVFTDQEQATMQYVERVVDASEWSAPFSEAYVAYLASKLAGSIIKGKEGERVAAANLQKAASYVKMASASEGNQRKPAKGPFEFVPDHLAHRGSGYDGSGVSGEWYGR